MELKDLRNARMSMIQELGQFYGIRTVGGSGGYASGAWQASSPGPGGRVYFIPTEVGDKVEVLDTKSTAAVTTTINSVSAGRLTAVLAPNGKIYCAPFVSTSNTVMIIDTATNSVSYTNYGLSIPTGLKWVNGIYHPNGKIYFSPFGNDQYLVIDTLTETATYTRLSVPQQLFVTPSWTNNIIAVSSTGNLYIATPGSLGYYDMSSGQFVADNTYSAVINCGTIVNDVLYTSALNGAAFNTFTAGSGVRLDVSFGGALISSSARMAVGGDGHIYCSPLGANANRFNPIAYNNEFDASITYSGTTQALSEKTFAASLGANGRVYCPSFRYGTHVILIPAGGSRLPEHLRLGFKKLLTAA